MSRQFEYNETAEKRTKVSRPETKLFGTLFCVNVRPAHTTLLLL